MAQRGVLRSVENQDQNKNLPKSRSLAEVQAAQNEAGPVKASKSCWTRQHLSKPLAMRRSGRGQARDSYREESDPIESSSSDADLGVDQRADRCPPGRPQHNNQLADYARADKGASEGAPVQDSADIPKVSDVELNEDSESDFQRPRSAARTRHKAGGKQAVGQQPAEKGRRAATAISSDDAAAVSSEEDEQADEQSEQEDKEQTEQPSGQEKQQQQQRKSKRAASAAASKRITRGQQQDLVPQQNASAPRRSSRVAAAAAGAAEPEPVTVARPRRAAAAAAAAATAAALLSEQERLRFSSSSPVSDGINDTDDDLGSRGGSSDEEEALIGDEDSTEDEAAASSEEDDSSCSRDGTGRKQHMAAAPAGRARLQRRRRTADNGNSDSTEASDQEESSGAYEAQEDHSDLQDEKQVPDLNAFRFGNKTTAVAAAAAASQANDCSGGICWGRSSTGRDNSSPTATSGEEKGEAAGWKCGRLSLSAAALAAEAEAGAVCNPADFQPAERSKLSRKDDVEKILKVRYENDGRMNVLVKLVGKSYREAVWVPSKQVEAKGRQQLLRNFVAKQASEGPPAVVIDPQWYQIERIVEEWQERKSGETQYLVKWAGLEYVDLTWETEEQVKMDGQGRAALARFKRWVKPPAHVPRPAKRPTEALLKQQLLPNFLNGRKLREYQETSLHWMINNYRGEIRNGHWWPRNCILGDEMGLGKTAQSISVMAWLRQYGGVTGPFMVVAPLTTLHHWRREIETWTGMNAVLYTGSARDRQLIRETEFYYPSDKTARKALGARFDVLLTSYETVLKDKIELKKISYEVLILDEAHRLKTRTSSTRAALLELPVRWWLLLSGTPVQNNMRELQGLMSVLDDEAYGDLDDFLERYGDGKPTIQQIRDLQAALAPVLLRRMKEDVENLPEKEEVVIWVELTQEQRRYYRALYSKQIGSLLQGVAAKHLPGMRNLAMELRKLCCHPFLSEGLEEDMAARWSAAQAAGAAGAANQEVEALTRASGKMLLLHKLLPKLKAEGRQVLIFSQFKMMLDVLEDYLAACNYPYERIDGDTKHKERQAAIDRFMATKDKKANSRSTTPAAQGFEQPGREGLVQDNAATVQGADADAPFVFLLSTRAGGQGITLTSADTVIIYDSDWNPQNDLQAMARCHRIGQDRDVTVYRLVSQNTYEQQLFECASKKYGLDEAILGFAGTEDNPENDAARIEQLLRLGAHAIAGADAPAGEQEEDKGMAAEGIDQILAGRSEKRQLGSRKGNTFSTAHFAAAGAGQELPEEAQEEQPVDAKAFWSDLLPEAVAAHAASLAAAKEPLVLGRRRRTVVNYREKGYSRFDSDSDDEDGKASKRAAKRAAEDEDDYDARKEEGKQDDDLQANPKKKRRSRAVLETGHSIDPELGRAVQPWTNSQVETAFAAVLRWGPDRVDKVLETLDQTGVERPADEATQFIAAIQTLLTELSKLPEANPAPKLAATPLPAGSVPAAGETPPNAAAAFDPAAADANKADKPGNFLAALRDGLAKAGVADKLPLATRKALLSSTFLIRVGKSPSTWLLQLQEHQKVHQRMVVFGHAPSTSKAAAGGTAAAAAAAGTPQKQPMVAAVGAPPTGGGLKSPGKHSRLVPRVSLKGFRQLPAWWSRDHDSRLLLGSYNHGYSHHGKMTGIVEDILRDPAYGFTTEVALDPVAAVLPTVASHTHSQLVTVAAGDQPAPGFSAAGQLSISPQQLVEAKAKRQAMIAATVDPCSIQWMGPADWKKFVSTAVARLKKVRACMLDPGYVEPPKGATPCKPTQPPQLQLNKTPASATQTAPAVGTAATTAERPQGAHGKLSFGCMLSATPSAAQQAVQRANAAQQLKTGNTAAAQTAAQAVQRYAAEQTQLAAQQTMRQPQQIAQCAAQQPATAAARAAAASGSTGALLSQAAATPATLSSFAKKKRPSSGLDVVLVSDDDSDDFQQPPSNKQQAGGEAARAAKKQKTAAAKPVSKQQQGRTESAGVIDLASHGNFLSGDNTTGKPAAAAPSKGLVMKRVPVEQLSQDKSVDVDEPDAADTHGTPAIGDKVEVNGRQQMQQLLGSSERAAGAGTAAGGSSGTPGQPHPVYGTPASDAAAAGASNRQASSKGMKGRDHGKQRKIDSFFSVKKQ